MAEAFLYLFQVIISDFSEHSPSYNIVAGNRYWRVSNHMLKLDIIRQGRGWGNVPKHLADYHLQSDELIVIELSGFPAITANEIQLYRKRGWQMGPVANALWPAA